MSNMSYCRFENTYRDLVDCQKHIDDGDLSDSEKAYAIKMLKVCRQMVKDDTMFDEEADDDEEEEEYLDRDGSHYSNV